MNKCFFCGKENDLTDFAYIETPSRPVIEAHVDCTKRFGFAEALVAVKK